MQSELSVLYTANKPNRVINKKAFRHISQTPERILDAPELLDDYYLNLIDIRMCRLVLCCLRVMYDFKTGCT